MAAYFGVLPHGVTDYLASNPALTQRDAFVGVFGAYVGELI
jgi:hypothetical protein